MPYCHIHNNNYREGGACAYCGMKTAAELLVVDDAWEEVPQNCPECKGKGGWMVAEYESGGACVGQHFDECEVCRGLGTSVETQATWPDNKQNPNQGGAYVNPPLSDTR